MLTTKPKHKRGHEFIYAGEKVRLDRIKEDGSYFVKGEESYYTVDPGELKPVFKLRKPIVSRAKKKSVYDEKRELNIWFAEQINIMPRYCEETGNYLNPYMPWGARAYIAHICPKRHFKSVQCHPANRMFYDIDAHTNFDRATSKEIKQMKSYPLIVQRFNEFKNLIPQSEYEHLPDYLFELL